MQNKYSAKSIKIIEISGGCAGCAEVTPVLYSVAEKFGLEACVLDAEREPEAIKKYGVKKIPSIILTDEEGAFASCSGYQPQEILSLWTEAKIEERLKK